MIEEKLERSFCAFFEFFPWSHQWSLQIFVFICCAIATVPDEHVVLNIIAQLFVQKAVSDHQLIRWRIRFHLEFLKFCGKHIEKKNAELRIFYALFLVSVFLVTFIHLLTLFWPRCYSTVLVSDGIKISIICYNFYPFSFRTNYLFSSIMKLFFLNEMRGNSSHFPGLRNSEISITFTFYY